MHSLAIFALSFTMLFGGVNMQAAQVPETASITAGCDHGSDRKEYADRILGGYNHTYIGSDGNTKTCAVTVIETGYYRICSVCGVNKGYTQTGTWESHSNPSHK